MSKRFDLVCLVWLAGFTSLADPYKLFKMTTWFVFFNILESIKMLANHSCKEYIPNGESESGQLYQS